MQFHVLVLIPSETADVLGAVTSLMEPFGDARKVPPRKEFVPEDEIHWTASTLGIAEDNLEELCAEIQDESGRECGIEDKRIYWITTDNPQAYWVNWRLLDLKESIWPVPSVPRDHAPLAVITPDGVWHDLGYRWSTDQDPATVLWRRAEPLLLNYNACLAVVVEAYK